jgi:hypothetical protein
LSKLNYYSGNNKRGRGRPKGAGKRIFYGKCDVRLDKQELEMLSQLADRNDVTRSDVMRKALRDYWKFNSEGGVEV